MSARGSSTSRTLVAAVIAAAFAVVGVDVPVSAATRLSGDNLLNADRDSEPWSPPRYATTATTPQIASTTTPSAATTVRQPANNSISAAGPAYTSNGSKRDLN